MGVPQNAADAPRRSRLAFVVFGIDGGLWRYASIWDLLANRAGGLIQHPGPFHIPYTGLSRRAVCPALSG